jgi:hypothetical protein
MAHDVHTPVPFPSLNVPAGQAEHGPPSFPMYPPSQMHCATSKLCAGEFEFAEQVCSSPNMHHVPCWHREHVPPSSPLKPPTHVQFVISNAPASDQADSGHEFCFPP